MDQETEQGIKRERHTKDDRKKYRKRRELRKKQGEKASVVEKSAIAVAVEAPTMPKANIFSRARTMVKMTVSRNPRSTFLTPYL